MAGRVPTGNHRGRPKRLGCPEPGLLRRLTTNEAVATGFTRSSLVLGAPGDCVVLFKARSTGTGVAYRAVDYDANPRAYNDLYRFWGDS
jgi:hypothetical protein